MLKLKEDVQRSANLVSYDLDEKKIKDLSAFVPLLAKFRNLKRVSIQQMQLSVRENQLQRLPATFVTLKSIEELDLSDNNFKEIEDIVATLKGLPKLRQLSIDCDHREDEETVIKNLPELRYLNGKAVERDKVDKARTLSSQLITIDKGYLVRIADMSDQLNKLVEKSSPAQKQDFVSFLQTTFQSLAEFLSGNDKNQLFLAARIVQTRHQLQRFCLKTLSQHLSTIQPQLHKFLEALLQFQDANIKNLLSLITIHQKQKIDQRIALRSEAIDKVNDRLQQLKEQNAELSEKVKQLEEDNRSYIEKLIEYAKSISQANVDQNVNLNSKLFSYQSGFKLVPETKKMNHQQVEQLIVQIYDTKKKHEDIKNKVTSMALYLPKFFHFKFGIPQLSNFYYNLFKQSLANMTETQSTSILTFQYILNNQCQESYRQQQKKILENLNTIIRRIILDRQLLPEYELSRIMSSKMYDHYSSNNFKLEEQTIYAILRIIYPDHMGTIVNTLNQLLGVDWKRSLQSSAERKSALPSPSKSTYRFRNPVPFSTPSPRKQKNQSFSNQSRSLTYKKFVNIIMNMQLDNHIKKIQRITNLFNSFDQNNDGVIDKITFLSLLSRLQVQITPQLNLSIQQYLQHPKPVIKRQSSYYEEVDNKEIYIVYTSFIEFAKRKHIRGKTLIEVQNKQNVELV